MHGYALDLGQRLVPETFKYQILTDITARMLIDRNSKKSGVPDPLCWHADTAPVCQLPALHAVDERATRGRR